MAKHSIPEGYQEYPEDRVQRLNTKSTGGKQMRLSGTIFCPKSDCGRNVPFQLRTHDASKVEFRTTCRRCKTRIELVLFVAEAGRNESNKTPFEMIENAQPKTSEVQTDEERGFAIADVEKLKIKKEEKNAVEQLPNATDVESGQFDEDQNKSSGDEQGAPIITVEEVVKPTEKDPFEGLE